MKPDQCYDKFIGQLAGTRKASIIKTPNHKRVSRGAGDNIKNTGNGSFTVFWALNGGRSIAVGNC